MTSHTQSSVCSLRRRRHSISPVESVRWTDEQKNCLREQRYLHKDLSWAEFTELSLFPGRTQRALETALQRMVNTPISGLRKDTISPSFRSSSERKQPDLEIEVKNNMRNKIIRSEDNMDPEPGIQTEPGIYTY
ncbi:hypothetical protein BJX70DRAFT_404946 [Aspergillus crustosus]